MQLLPGLRSQPASALRAATSVNMPLFIAPAAELTVDSPFVLQCEYEVDIQVGESARQSIDWYI
jgi:flagellar assembly factor FliW